MNNGNGGQSDYPAGLSGPKSTSMVFCSDLRPMIQFSIAENSYVTESNFFGMTLSGGIEYVASQFQETGGYRTHDAALRTLYRVLYEQPVCGAQIGDALAIACNTSLYTEDVREYPSRYKSALEIVFIEADEAGLELTPVDLVERATLLWHETYDRYVIEMEPFREKYEQARIQRRESRARRAMRV